MLSEIIARVAKFAQPESSAVVLALSNVRFSPGEVYAQNAAGGMRAKVDLDLDCSVNGEKLIKVLKSVGGEPISANATRLPAKFQW